MDFSEAFSPSRAIRDAVEAIQRFPAPMLLGGFLVVTVGMCGGGFQGTGSGDMEGVPSDAQALLAAVTLVVVAIGLVLSLLSALAQSFLLPGWYRLHRDIVVDGVAQPGTLFSGGDAFLSMFGWKLLSGIIGLGVAVVSVAPGAAVGFALRQEEYGIPLGVGIAALVAVPVLVYVGLGLALGPWVVALEGRGPLEALDRSWELASGHRLDLFLFLIVMGLLNFAGVLCCCVGLYLSFPVVDFATTESFLLATRPGLTPRLSA